eukprot:UN10761
MQNLMPQKTSSSPIYNVGFLRGVSKSVRWLCDLLKR